MELKWKKKIIQENTSENWESNEILMRGFKKFRRMLGKFFFKKKKLKLPTDY
jgi:hypothetical protein